MENSDLKNIQWRIEQLEKKQEAHLQILFALKRVLDSLEMESDDFRSNFEEAKREFSRLLIAEVIRKVLRSYDTRTTSLERVLAVLIEEDNFIDVSTLVSKADLFSDQSLRRTLAWLNQRDRRLYHLSWDSLLERGFNEQTGEWCYRLPEHLREIVREILSGE